MAEVHYTLVYDVLNEGTRPGAWPWMLAVFVAGCVAATILLAGAIRKRRKRAVIVGAIWLALWIPAWLAGIAVTAAENRKCAQWAQAGDFQVVEGPVTNFKPMPATGHTDEEFTVNGVTFSYSDYDLSKCGFHQSAALGGPIRAGLWVRVAYREGRILKLEVRPDAPAGQ